MGGGQGAGRGVSLSMREKIGVGRHEVSIRVVDVGHQLINQGGFLYNRQKY